MDKMIALLDRLPLGPLLLIGGLLALSPFVPEPHLVEKLRMLSQGALTRPLDIFDLIFHAVPALLIVAKLARVGYLRRKQP